ncbi:MAG TPA: hypothetical protein VFL12_13560 [Thermoanaerobaculia bacterium]|nr:hypothetical protein [Thermoanaerobaculia bacterium]
MKPQGGSPSGPGPARLARRALFAFATVFALSRILVFLIMDRRIPNLFLFLRGTHVHHLNYGIFLLAGTAAWLLFRRPEGVEADRAALAYGVAMALTFDEFGMWLHLGGSYWQRASVDAVILVAAALGTIAFFPSVERLRTRHRLAVLALVLAAAAFAAVVVVAGRRIGHLVGPRLEELESSSSP